MEDFFANELVTRFEKMLEEQDYYFFDSTEYVEIVEYYLDVADLEYVQKALHYAFSQYPTHIIFKVKLLEYYVEAQLLKKAKNLIEELDKYALSDLDYLISKAKYFSAKRMHKKAIEVYKIALKEHKQEQEYVHNSIGNEYLELNQIQYALLHFQEALSINIKDEYAFYSCIHCYEDLHKPNQCIEFIQQYINQNPYSETAWFQLGTKYLQEKNYSEALQAFDYAHVINPTSIINYTQKACCLEALKCWNEAIYVYYEAMEYEESPTYLLLKIGKCFNRIKEPYKALRAFLRAAKVDAQVEEVWYNIALTYEKLENLDDALHYIKKSIELDNENIKYLKKQTYLHIKLSYFEEAIQDFKKMLILEPHNYNNHYAFSELLLSIGEIETAIPYLEKSSKKFKKADLLYQLSYCYYIKSQNKKGEETLKKAVKLNPKIVASMYKKYPLLKEKFSTRTKKEL